MMVCLMSPGELTKYTSSIITVDPPRTGCALLETTANRLISITIYNLRGDKIITLLNHQNNSAGAYHEVKWDGRDTNGNSVGSGIYIVHLQAGNYQDRAKIAAIK